MPRTGEFYSKRLWRILPSYLFAIAACLVFTALYGRNLGSAPLWKDLLTHLTFTHTFWRGTYLWSSLNVALWTLAVEMQFYLLFPLVGRAFPAKPWLTFCGMTAAGGCSARTDLAAGGRDRCCSASCRVCWICTPWGCSRPISSLIGGGSRRAWLSLWARRLCLAGIPLDPVASEPRGQPGPEPVADGLAFAPGRAGRGVSLLRPGSVAAVGGPRRGQLASQNGAPRSPITFTSGISTWR